MGTESLLVFLIIGAIAGWLAGLIVSFRGSGWHSEVASARRSSMPPWARSSCWSSSGWLSEPDRQAKQAPMQRNAL
jgi:hypothetical protein